MIDTDTWKPIGGYEGTYEFSILGVRRISTGRILKQSLDDCGRLRVMLCLRGKKKNLFVAHLVADAFLPPKSSDDQVLRHLNDDPTDNRIENLAWGTQRDNMADSLHNGTRPRGITHGMAKLTEDNVREIRRLYATGVFTQQELALRFGVSCRMIRYIIRNEKWQHVI